MKQYREKYPDAQKTVLAVSWEVLKNINFNKKTVLMEHFKSSFEGLCILDCWYEDRKVTFITSEAAYSEEQRQLKMQKGTVVKMKSETFEVQTNPEFENKEWVVVSDPEWMGGGLVVWLDGYSGAFSCEFLEIVKVEEESQTN